MQRQNRSGSAELEEAKQQLEGKTAEMKKLCNTIKNLQSNLTNAHNKLKWDDDGRKVRSSDPSGSRKSFDFDCSLPVIFTLFTLFTMQ